MTIKIGDSLPQVTFMMMDNAEPRPISTDAVCTGQRVVIFAVPGAFTPTCSAQHLPGYKNHIADFKAKNIDQIVCIAVNDAFVMDAWRKAEGIDTEIMMLADGNGTFTKAIGLELDASGFGLGMRSQRYAMVVKNGHVSALYVEEPGEFQVSAAEYVLEHL